MLETSGRAPALCCSSAGSSQHNRALWACRLSTGCHRRKRSFSTGKKDSKADSRLTWWTGSSSATSPKQWWIADVTCVPTVHGWLYPACVMASSGKTYLVVGAVSVAVHRRGGRTQG